MSIYHLSVPPRDEAALSEHLFWVKSGHHKERVHLSSQISSPMSLLAKYNMHID